MRWHLATTCLFTAKQNLLRHLHTRRLRTIPDRAETTMDAGIHSSFRRKTGCQRKPYPLNKTVRFTIRFTPQAAKADSKRSKGYVSLRGDSGVDRQQRRIWESRSEFLVGAASIFLHAETEQMLDKEKAGILLTVTNSNNKPARVVNLAPT